LLGFDKQIWTATVVDSDTPQLVLEYTSKDGEEGFPGELTTKVTYTVTTDNSLRIEYHATTNAPTVINLTNHSYFNLSAGRAKDALDHVLQLDADSFTPVDETSIPTGEIKSVKDTPYDFSSPQVIGTRIDQVDSGGYDHNWVINGTGLKHAATVYEPLSGRVLQVSTTHPGVQFYAGNYLDGMQGKQGKFIKRYGFCLETQHFPDSPNKPQFPSTVLRAGTAYDHVTIFKFSTRE
jgi:aldose 1-epimerase